MVNWYKKKVFFLVIELIIRQNIYPNSNLRDHLPQIDYDKIELPTMEESLPDVPPAPRPESEPDPSDQEPPERRERGGRIEVPSDPQTQEVGHGRKRSPETTKPKSIRQRVISWLPR